MKSVTEQLANYACYHRDIRNIVTHFVGIPLIVISLLALLSRPAFDAGFLTITPALILVIASVAYYLKLDVMLGIVMAVLLVIALTLGNEIAALSTTAWLVTSIGVFIIGWLFQFIGHVFEGRKPAFVDDVIGLAIGPLFVVAEAVFMLGLRKDLHQKVEKRVGEMMADARP